MLVRFLTQSLKIVSVLLLAVLIVAGSVGFFNYWTEREQAEEIGRPVTLTISEEDDGSTVADKLTDADLIQYGFYFETRFRFANTDFRPGTYTLLHGMSVPDILSAITVPTEDEGDSANQAVSEPGEAISVTFIEGERIEQYAQRLSEAGWEGDPADFIAMAYSPVGTDSWDILNSLPSGVSLEGYLFPDTYNLASNASAQDVINLLLGQFDLEFDSSMRQSASEQDLTIHEVVTLASIVERESAVEGERVTVAGLYRNRVDQGMPLQADPTAQYAVGSEDDWWPELDGNLLEQALDSPYNTYSPEVTGLPPGPIANPGIRAMQAVLQPEQHDYLFMQARNDGTGTHAFSSSLAEHELNICTYNPDAEICN